MKKFNTQLSFHYDQMKMCFSNPNRSNQDEVYEYLPAATKLWPRLCFYTCLWFCPQGGSPENPPNQADPPGDQADTPPDQGEPPGPGRHPPWEEPPSPPPRPGRPAPPDQADTPPRTKENPPPGKRLQHTVNERPVRILLECILVFLSICTIENPTTPTGRLTKLQDIYFVASLVSGSLERSHDELDSSYKGQGHQRSKSLGEPKKMAKQCKCSNWNAFDSETFHKKLLSFLQRRWNQLSKTTQTAWN